MIDRLLAIIESSGLESGEIADLIASNFSGGRQLDVDAFGYGDGDVISLILHYEDEYINRIEPGPGLTPERLAELEQKFSGESNRTDFVVNKTFLFSNVPTLGYWRYGDDFQILPPPPNAPRPPQFIAPHPLLLEFKTRASGNTWVGASRKAAREREICQALNAFLHFRVRTLRSSDHHHWVLEPPPPDAHQGEHSRQVLFAQEYYAVEGLRMIDTHLSEGDDSTRPLTIEPDAIHYGRVGVSVTGELTIPASLQALFDRYFSLDQVTRRRASRSFHWLSYSASAWRLSQSAAFAALVQAIEALLPDVAAGSPCPTCARPTGHSRGQQFRQFIEQYVPDLDGRARRTLYAARSAILHGGHLFPWDMPATSFAALEPETVRTWELFGMAHTAAQWSLLGWLTEGNLHP